MRIGVKTTFSGLLVAFICGTGPFAVWAQEGAASPDPAATPPAASSSLVDDLVTAGTQTAKDLKKALREQRRALELQAALALVDQAGKNMDQNSQIDDWKKKLDDPSTTPTERENIKKLIDVSIKTGKTPNQILDGVIKEMDNETSPGATPPSNPGASGGGKTPTAAEIAAEIRQNIAIRDANDDGIRRAINESPDPKPLPPPPPPPPSIPPASPWTDEGLTRDKDNAQAGIAEIDQKIAELRAAQNKGHRGDKDIKEAIEQAEKDREDWARRLKEDDEALQQNRDNRNAQQTVNNPPPDPSINPSLLQDFDPRKNKPGGDDGLAGASRGDQQAADAADNANQAAQTLLNGGGNSISGQTTPAGDDGKAIDDAFNTGSQQGASDGRMAAQLKDPNKCDDSKGTHPDGSKPKPDPNPDPAIDDPAPPPPPEAPPAPEAPAPPAPKPPCSPPSHFPGDPDGCT